MQLGRDRWYIDADTLGVAAILVRARPDITFPGDTGERAHPALAAAPVRNHQHRHPGRRMDPEGHRGRASATGRPDRLCICSPVPPSLALTWSHDRPGARAQRPAGERYGIQQVKGACSVKRDRPLVVAEPAGSAATGHRASRDRRDSGRAGVAHLHAGRGAGGGGACVRFRGRPSRRDGGVGPGAEHLLGAAWG